MACATLTFGTFPAKTASGPNRTGRPDRPFPHRFFLRIGPRRYDTEPVAADAIEVPRGEEPARAGRPVLAFMAILVFAVGVMVQVDRWQDCRAEGGDGITCLLVP